MESAPTLDLSGIRVTGEAVSAEPLNALDRLTLLGQPSDVGGVLRAIGRLPGAARVAWPDEAGRLTVGRFAAPHGTPSALADACAHFGFPLDRSRRTRLRDLDAESRARLICALTLATGGQWLVLEDPLHGLGGQARAGLRGRLLDACTRFERGLVVSGSSVMDAAVLGGRTVTIEKEQIADSAPLAVQLREPRSNLAAAATGVSVFSGLARRGWLSIGHSQVRARTELDGKVYVTIPTSAARLSFDEFDPAFTSNSVFEALIVAVRDSGPILQVVLSPADTEVGLAMTVDLLDFSAVADTGGSGFGVLHPGLATSVADTVARVRTGTRLFVDVDTTRMRAYPAEAPAGRLD
ncbi:hypothetical protein ACUXNS_000726 [Brevibacterium pityocampae]